MHHFTIATVMAINPGQLGPEAELLESVARGNLYVASGIAKMGITELTVAVWPWLLTMLIFLGIVTYVPEISLWLPRALGML